MCNQILACNNMIGMTESLLYAHRAGLDVEGVIKAIGAGAAGSWVGWRANLFRKFEAQ